MKARRAKKVEFSAKEFKDFKLLRPGAGSQPSCAKSLFGDTW
jgi:hypothetical protein